MMLQHLYNADVEKFLQLVSDSSSKYLLTTNFPRHEINTELKIVSTAIVSIKQCSTLLESSLMWILFQDKENPGRFRRLNLEVPPYSLVPPICIQRDGPPGDFDAVHHYIALWKLPLTRVALCKEPWAMYLKGSKQLFYSCVQWGHRNP